MQAKKKGPAQTKRDDDNHQSRERRICKENHRVQKAVLEKMAYMSKKFKEMVSNQGTFKELPGVKV